METRRVLTASDGVNLVYRLSRRDRSGRRVLLLLHGANSNHTRWSELVETTALAERWSILSPDLRGNGESQTRRRHGMETWCSDLVEILDQEGFAEALVVGHSLGAQIALHLERRSPERVCGLALIDPVFLPALRGKQGFYSRHPWLLKLALAVVRSANAVGLHRRRIPHRDLRELDEETRRALGGEASFEVIAKRYGALGPVLRHMPVANFLRQMIATVEPNPPLADVGVPVLVLLSTGISFAELGVSVQEVGRFPDGELVLLDSNHWPLTETPDDVREALEDWVDRRFPL